MFMPQRKLCFFYQNTVALLYSVSYSLNRWYLEYSYTVETHGLHEDTLFTLSPLSHTHYGNHCLISINSRTAAAHCGAVGGMSGGSTRSRGDGCLLGVWTDST